MQLIKNKKLNCKHNKIKINTINYILTLAKCDVTKSLFTID